MDQAGLGRNRVATPWIKPGSVETESRRRGSGQIQLQPSGATVERVVVRCNTSRAAVEQAEIRCNRAATPWSRPDSVETELRHRRAGQIHLNLQTPRP